MGWKNIKEHYRIEHIVHLRDGNLCIGSPYISDIIVVNLSGALLKQCTTGLNEHLRRYQDEIKTDPATFQRLMQEPDQFAASITIYTCADGEIINQQCEIPGWPNVTHDGHLMYENTHFTDRAKCVTHAISDYAAGVSFVRRDIAETEARLQWLHKELAKYEGYIATLKAEYPTANTDGDADKDRTHG